MAVDVGIDWLSWLQFLVTVLSPFLAAVGAWLVYRAQKKHEREEELRKERSTLYREYLHVLKEISHETESETYLMHGLTVLNELSPYHDQIALIAPDSVARASLKFLNMHVGECLKDQHMLVRPHKRGRISEQSEIERDAQIGSRIAEARNELLLAMRRDLIAGTSINPSLTSLEEIAK